MSCVCAARYCKVLCVECVSLDWLFPGAPMSARESTPGQRETERERERGREVSSGAACTFQTGLSLPHSCLVSLTKLVMCGDAGSSVRAASCSCGQQEAARRVAISSICLLFNMCCHTIAIAIAIITIITIIIIMIR